MNILLKEAIRRYGNLKSKPTKPVVKTGGSHTIPHLVNQLIKSHISKMNPTK